MKIGIIGENNNFISYSMLINSSECAGIEILWMIDASLSTEKHERLYGKNYTFKERPIDTFRKIKSSLWKRKVEPPAPAPIEFDSKYFCESRGIPYIYPANNDINSGLPQEMYSAPQADYVLIAGCDQILNVNGLKIAKQKIINYHYSALPAYRGKNVVVWQWFNREPYIGFTFHEIDLDIDKGEIIFQGKVEYIPEESISNVTNRVIDISGKHICKVYECLRTNQKILLNGERLSSYYSQKKFLNLLTADRSRTVNEMLDIHKRFGYFRLKNGLQIGVIIQSGPESVEDYKIDQEGIVVPLSDGFIKGALDWRGKNFFNKRRILKELKEVDTPGAGKV